MFILIIGVEKSLSLFIIVIILNVKEIQFFRILVPKNLIFDSFNDN